MPDTIAPCPRFDPASVAHLEEPVRRYLTHALVDGAALHEDVELTMVGRIKAGSWLAFSARQQFAGHDFEWRARAGWGAFKPVHVTDRYSDGKGSTVGRLFGRFPFLDASGEDTTRAAAGRGAVESIWVPASLLPERGVRWRAEADDHIVATFSAPPEHPDLHLRIDARGAVTSVSVLRWGKVAQPDFGYIPFGADVHAERRFGGVCIPSQVTVGWWFGTPRFAPFFESTVLEAWPSQDSVVHRRSHRIAADGGRPPRP
ncbi:MAG TPA: DUF6544 family protein [Blastococcus sp.]|jgi:hypothetical protein